MSKRGPRRRKNNLQVEVEQANIHPEGKTSEAFTKVHPPVSSNQGFSSHVWCPNGPSPTTLEDGAGFQPLGELRKHKKKQGTC
jgi:hypothetical protein